MRGAVAERRRVDFDIPAPLPRVCSHIRGADAGGSAISWGQWWFGARGFEAGAVNWVLDPFVAERFLLPLRLRSATAYVWTHVMICVEANFPPAPARDRPRMCERTFIRCFPRYLQMHFVVRGMPQNCLSDRPLLVHVMAWCLVAPSYYLSQCWPRSMSAYDIIYLWQGVHQYPHFLLKFDHPLGPVSLTTHWGTFH